MLLTKEFSVIFLLIVASVLCEDDELLIKQKREASIGSYSYKASDESKHESNPIKAHSYLKSVEKPKHESYKRTGKTTIEFWPPDMDKQKFYTMRGLEDPSMELWPRTVEHEVFVMVEKPSSESLPAIPTKSKDIKKEIDHKLPDIPTYTKTVSYEPELHDLISQTESYISKLPEKTTDNKKLVNEDIKPTESIVLNDNAITDSGPVIFPTLDPTTKGPGRNIVYIPRNNGNKKRKLKKKAKQANTAVEVNYGALDPISISVNGEEAMNEQHVTPIYEHIDEPPQDIFLPNQIYTDVINNLSNLTEQTFGMKRDNVTDNKIKTVDQMKIIDAQQSTNDNDFNDANNVNASDTTSNNQKISGLKLSRGSRRRIPSKPLSMEDLTPLEKLFQQLKSAIDERDVAKIKNIVRLMEEPIVSTEASIIPSTTEIKTTESTTVPIPTSTEIKSLEIAANSTSQPLTEETTTVSSKNQVSRFSTSTEETSSVSSKIYLAPRVRLAQKKLKELREKAFEEEKLQSITTEATASTSALPTTESVVTTSLISILMPTRRRSRSHITPRIRSIAARSRQAAKNKINRRIRQASRVPISY